MPLCLLVHNYLKFRRIFSSESVRSSCIMTNFCLPYKNFKGFYEGIDSERVACHGKQEVGLEGKYFYGQGR
jgi:hypothetical protein